MEFYYNKQISYDGTLEIQDVGNTALEIIDDKGFYYYYGTKTSMGKTLIIFFGPIIPDIKMLPKEYVCNLRKLDYKENILIKDINKYLLLASDAKVVDLDTILNNYRDLKEYIIKF